MLYSVHYRKIGAWRWRKLPKIKGDGLVEGGQARFFILEDESRVEVPMAGVEFRFGKERFFLIRQQMEKEAGQKLGL